MDDGSNSFEKIKTRLEVESEHVTVTATLRKFSSEVIHRPSLIAEQHVGYKVSSERFNHYYSVTVYGNGSDASSEGYVSIVFGMENAYAKYSEAMCVVAVIDDEGSKRFSQSFVFVCDRGSRTSVNDDESKFVIDRYLPRATLLEEPRDLLPNDALTLNVEVQLTESCEMQYVHDIRSGFVESSFHRQNLHECKYALFLDSLVAERLREESRYFKRILVTPMTEKKTRYMNIPAEEYQTFVEIGCVLLGANSIKVHSFDDVFRLYAFADKYDVPVVMNTCRSLLTSCLAEDNVSEISEFADMYNDVETKENAAAFLSRCQNKAPSEDEKSSSNEWTCAIIAEETTSHLLFAKQTIDQDKNDFDFYK